MRGDAGTEKFPRSDWEAPLFAVETQELCGTKLDLCSARGDLAPDGVWEVSAEQVTGFFLKHARERQLSDRQFRRIAEAVQLVLVDLAQVPVLSALDWDYWKEARSALKGGHGGVAARMQAQDCLGLDSPGTW